jgi:CRP-like cAMP-binding protein
MLTLGGARDDALPASPFVIPMTQEELALTSCLTRKAVHKILNALEKQGYCALRYRVIEILDAQALARVVMTDAKGSR